ncbi:MAG: ABC transporter permease [Defluviitaleaceae bacterium]|nr:ABC transporter permease [Defluviitaleaceae bacterium]
MSGTDIFTMAIRNLFKRKLRTFLTVLGVIIGAASIVIMISLGVGANMTFDMQIESIGREALRVSMQGAWNPTSKAIEDSDINAIRRLPNVAMVTPMVDTNLTFVTGRYMATVQITGVLPEAMEAMGFNIQEGRNLDSDDSLSIVFGSLIPGEFRTAREHQRNQNMWWMGMFMGMGTGSNDSEPNIDALTSRFQASFVQGFGMNQNSNNQGQQSGGTASRIRPYTIEAVGILDGSDWQSTRSSFMPIDQVVEIIQARHRYEQQLTGGRGVGSNPLENGYPQAVVIVDDVNNVELVMEQIKDMGFEGVYSNIQWVNYLRESNASLETLLSAIGAVSLFVAAIGIANTMVMAIYERTREIGVMKVIGASVRDIRRLFLLEAAMIGAIGGALGLALSRLASYLLNSGNFTFFQTTEWIEEAIVSHIPLWLYGLGFGFSCAIGLISGFLPARRATKISALSAIRTD